MNKFCINCKHSPLGINSEICTPCVESSNWEHNEIPTRFSDYNGCGIFVGDILHGSNCPVIVFKKDFGPDHPNMDPFRITPMLETEMMNPAEIGFGLGFFLGLMAKLNKKIIVMDLKGVNDEG